MRKLITVITAFVLFLGYASAEETILFQDIPWLSDETIVSNSLSEKGCLREGFFSGVTMDKSGFFIKVDETGFIYPETSNNSDCLFSVNFTNYVKGRIAGCPIKDLSASFAYDGEFHLIAVKLKLINTTYKNLKNQLESVYGEYEERFNEDDIGYSIWRGDNSSCVMLFSYAGEYDYTILYGRLDAEEILNKCFEVDSNDTSGL